MYGSTIEAFNKVKAAQLLEHLTDESLCKYIDELRMICSKYYAGLEAMKEK